MYLINKFCLIYFSLFFFVRFCFCVLSNQFVLFQEEIKRLSGVRTLVNQLYEALNVEEHQLKKERELIAKLEDLRLTLGPMEKVRSCKCHYKIIMLLIRKLISNESRDKPFIFFFPTLMAKPTVGAA